MPNPELRLKEPAIAGYAYNPPQTPPFEKEGLVVCLLAYLTCGESSKERYEWKETQETLGKLRKLEKLRIMLLADVRELS